MRFPKLDELNRFSPKLCRAFACHNGCLFTQRELVERSGICKERIFRLSKLDRWDSVPIGEAFRYASACGLNLHRLRSDLYNRARWSKRVLTTMTTQQRKMYARLLSGS